MVPNPLFLVCDVIHIILRPVLIFAALITPNCGYLWGALIWSLQKRKEKKKLELTLSIQLQLQWQRRCLAAIKAPFKPCLHQNLHRLQLQLQIISSAKLLHQFLNQTCSTIGEYIWNYFIVTRFHHEDR